MGKINFNNYTIKELREFKKEIAIILSNQCINGHREKERRRLNMINDIEQNMSCEYMAKKYNRSIGTINNDIEHLSRRVNVYLKKQSEDKKLINKTKRELIIQEKQWLTETLNKN